MSNETRYGIIADVHETPERVPRALDILLNRFEVHGLILNGNFGDFRVDSWTTKKVMREIITEMAKSGKPVFVQPGSHESFFWYNEVVGKIIEENDNVFDTTKQQVFQREDHTLLFIPGSDSISGRGQFHMGNSVPTGRYFEVNDGERRGFIPMSNLQLFINLLKQGVEYEHPFEFFNIDDLVKKRMVKDPKRTIGICHVPRRFNHGSKGVDYAEFGVADRNFEIDGEAHGKGSIYRIDYAKMLKETGCPISLEAKNVGNDDLSLVYYQLGITKAVSAHFHESSHNAHDSKGNPVKEGDFTDNLFWNAGCLDKGHCGMLTVKGEMARYTNVDVA